MANKVSFIIQLKNKFGGVAKSFNRQFDKIERSAARANTQLKKFAKSGDKIKRIGKGFAKAGAVMSAAITVPIALIGRSMINAASDATETANKFNQVFDTVETKANKVADSFSKNFGVAGSTARRMIGDTGDLLVGFGFTGDAALEMADKVARLSSDLTSFQNFAGGAREANSALTKALLGESEAAKALGIVVRQGTPEFKRNVKIIMRSRRVNLLQAKAIEILRIATSQSQKAIGDVSRTWEDYASIVRRNKESTKELSESFGRLMIPLATKLIRTISVLTKWVNKLSPGMKTLVLILGGLAAIAGPLLLLIAGITAAFSVLTLPILAVSAGILGLIAVTTAVALNWESITKTMSALWLSFSTIVSTVAGSIGETFSSMWSTVSDGFLKFMNFAIGNLNALLKPFDFIAEKLGFDGVGIPEIKIAKTVQLMNSPSAPTAPISGGNQGTLNGMITVAAEKGSTVRQTALSTSGPGLNLGMNVAPGGA